MCKIVYNFIWVLQIWNTFDNLGSLWVKMQDMSIGVSPGICHWFPERLDRCYGEIKHEPFTVSVSFVARKSQVDLVEASDGSGSRSDCLCLQSANIHNAVIPPTYVTWFVNCPLTYLLTYFFIYLLICTAYRVTQQLKTSQKHVTINSNHILQLDGGHSMESKLKPATRSFEICFALYDPMTLTFYLFT